MKEQLFRQYCDHLKALVSVILLFVSSIIAVQMSVYRVEAQTIMNVTEGKVTYRPLVKNGRILWFEARPENTTVGRVSVYIYENGNNRLITNDASVLFPGWPDMDDNGNVAYMKNVGESHEVFVHDGTSETQITNNRDIDGSKIAMGLGAAKVYTGYVRVHDGDVVFRDRQGHIYLYERRPKRIRKITKALDQIANLGDDDSEKGSTGVGVPGAAHIKYYEFDGKHIVWMHEDRGSGNNATISVYMAKADKDPTLDFKPIKITSFDAWVPNDKAVLIGKLWNPFFRACNGEILWQYFLPSKGPNLPAGVQMPDMLKDYGANLDDGRVGYFDGTKVTELSRGTHVNFQSVRLVNGQAIWSHTRKEGEGKNVRKFYEVIAHGRGGPRTVVSNPEPDPKTSRVGQTFWQNILDAEIVGDQVFWVAGQEECFQQFKMPVTNEMYCMFKGGKQTGFFRESSGTEIPFFHLDAMKFGGGGEMDRGLFAFFMNTGIQTRDISAINVYGNADSGPAENVLAITDRRKPDERRWRRSLGSRKLVADAFSVSYEAIAACGGDVAAGDITIESFTLDVSAGPSPAARLEDIQSVALYQDENKNGQLDPGDKLLGRRNTPVPAEVIFTFSDGVKIPKGSPEYFLVEMEIKDEICPCGKYTVTVQGEKLGIKRQAGVDVTATGSSTGSVKMPEAEIIEITGDEQAGLPNQKLPIELSVKFENLAVRCGKAKFKISGQPPEKGALLLEGAGEPDEVIVDLTQVGSDATAGIGFQLGKTDGLYNVTASLVMEGGVSCDNDYYIFREHAGTMVVQLIDLNDPTFYSAVQDGSNPDYTTWKATMTGDTNALSTGGEGRKGAIADGVSMLLVRAKLIGFTDPPPGNVEMSIAGSDNIGHLSRGLGEAIPFYNGGASVSVPWVKTRTGVFAFALYTPPKNFGYSRASDRNVKLNVTYTRPGSSEPLVKDEDIALRKPPVALIHGLWSAQATWGSPYRTNPQYTGQYDIHFVDYSDLSSYSFTQLGTELKLGIEDIVKDLRRRKFAATRVNVVGHSMGGLVARQFFADDNGARFFRKDNFGKGDIYKLVTLGTPHFGSPVAWLTVTLRDSKYIPFGVVASDLGLDIRGGAIDALCPGSSDLQGLGVTHIPTHTVRAWNYDTRVKTMTVDDFYGLLALKFKMIITDPKEAAKSAPNALLWQIIKNGAKLTGKTYMSDLYGADRTDMLVTLESQSGGIAQGANNVFDKTIHFATPVDLTPLMYSETTSEEVAAYIFDTLNRDIDDLNYFAPKLPAPRVIDPRLSCQSGR